MQLPLSIDDLDTLSFSAKPPRIERVFCNRSLRLDQIDWIGFDMDYTLAVYRQDEMDRVSIQATLHKLVERGYPESLQRAPFRTDFAIRGLLIDRQLGNVLKMDRYKYVKRAYHGSRELTKEERREAYHRTRLDAGSSRFHFVDTLYALSEVCVFVAAVDHFHSLNQTVDYDKLFGDVRECIDKAHQDGTILSEILQNLGRFTRRDDELPRTLHALRSSGKKLFLLTNSHPPYTDTMMRYLMGEGDNGYRQWTGYFDLVVCAAKKPRFFTDSSPFQLVTAKGNVACTALERGQVYVGGNVHALQDALQTSPDRVLYVGDHIYGDVLRAKRETAWRTMMVIQEMEHELATDEQTRQSVVRLDELAAERQSALERLRDAQRSLRMAERRDPPDPEVLTRERRSIEKWRGTIKNLEQAYETLESDIASKFHPYWGSLFKVGPEVSSFGHQVETYACLYTARVSSLLRYSPMHFFLSPRDQMAHEQEE